MRIAVLTNDDPQHARGGAGRIAGLQIEMLRTAGHEVRVWCPKILWLEESKWRRLYHHLKDLCARSNIVAEIRDWKPDVLVTHNLTGCGFGSPSAIQSREVRWIHVLHDVQLFEPSGKVYDAMRITFWQRLWSCLRRRYFGTPNLVLSPTQWLMIEHQRRGFFLHTQTEVLPNPAPPVEFVSRQTRDPFRLLFAGWMTKEKGSHVLDEIERVTGWQIEKVSGLDHETVIKKMKEADVLLVPSLIAENQPTVILEAASVGLPVIASRIGGILETLKDYAFTCSSSDAYEWIRAMKTLRDEKTYQTAVAHMYQLAQEHDPRSYAEKFLTLMTPKGKERKEISNFSYRKSLKF